MMNWNYTYPDTTTTTDLSGMGEGFAGAAIWMIIALILAFVGAFIVYFLFVKSNKKFDNKFVAWLQQFLDFQSMLIEPIAKISYIFFALFITLSSFGVIGTSFLSFVVMLVFGNILVRVAYEFTMILISIWQNTRDINKKMK